MLGRGEPDTILSGVVHLGVRVLDAADQGARSQRRHPLQCSVLAEVLVVGQHIRASQCCEDVVQQDSAPHVGSLPDPVLQRIEEPDGPNQMRSEVAHQEPSLPECLHHEAEVELLEVTQAAVDQLR